ncbi:MAG: PAS domain S-box protein [Mariprofundaceae bacterium]|nr:PAS domain S-box protein [Mariprofundaceae bacterium]
MMDRLRASWQSVLVVVALCLLLLFLYQKTSQVNVASLYQVDALIQKLIATDIAMESDMVMLVSGRLTHYDSLNAGQQNIEKTASRIISQLHLETTLQAEIKALQVALALQKPPLEKFKMKLALFRNSMRYFPTLLLNLAEEYPRERPILLAVLHQVLLMRSQTLEFDKKILLELVAQLDDKDFAALKRHLQVMLKNHALVETSMYAFIHCGVDDAGEGLLAAFHTQFDQKMAKVNLYRTFLVFFTLCLLLYVGRVLWRLRSSQHALQKSHAFLHDLQQALDEHAIVTITNQRGDITYANDKFCAISGFRHEEVMGENHRLLKSDEHSPAFFKAMWTTIAGGEPWHGVLKNKNKHGGIYWVDTTIIPFLNDKGKPWQYIAIRTDVTDKVKNNRKLQESQAHYQLLANTIPDPVALVQKGLWVYLNPAAMAMFGAVKATDILGKKVMASVALESQSMMIQCLGKMKQEQAITSLQKVSLLHVDESTFTAEFQMAGMSWQGEAGVLLAMRDITERMAEQEKRKVYQEQLEHTQRLESLGVLAGGIAHDFNNILTSILGNVSLAERHVDAPQKVLPYLKKVQTASQRAAELCQQMLMYAGGGAIERRALSLEPLLLDMVDIAKVGQYEGISMKVDVAENMPAVDADVRQIQQVMLNLLTNAAEAIEGEGVVQVRLGVVETDETWLMRAVAGSGIQAGSYVFLEVKDNGCGMDEAIQSKVFDPFFTTKFTGRGLGMSAIQGIMSAHDGAITLISEPNQGTTIRVLFPVSETKLKQTKKKAVTQTIQVGSGSILIIDDEEDILELLEAVLSGVGFTVLKAGNGEEGIAMFDTHRDEIVAVVSDMVMPKASGAVVAKYIHQHAPHIKVLLSSGYDEAESMKLPSGVLAGFIQKPYSPRVFLNAVFQALDDETEV